MKDGDPLMQLPLLEACTALVIGGGIKAMACALRLRSRGENVLLVTRDTCLYAEIARTGDLLPPTNLGAVWQALLFPPQVMDGTALLHPDRLKLHAEQLFGERGIRLLYACQILGVRDGFALAAHKSGLYAIECLTVYDCRAQNPLLHPCTCLHIMQGDALEVRRILTLNSACDASSRFQRYEQALSQLPKGCTLARGGVYASELHGLPFGSLARAGRAKTPDKLPYQDASCNLRCFNPLHHAYFQRTLALPNPKTDDYDLVVVGGGTAGAVAALHGARQGLHTLLIEMNEQLGGTATVGGVSTYWFGERIGATAQIDEAVDRYYRELQLPRTRCLWSQNDVFAPDLKAHALLGLCLNANVEVRFGCIACGVEQPENRVEGVYYAMEDAFYLAKAKLVLDCTGDGDLCMFAGAAHTYGNKRDGMTYWGSLAQFTAPDQYRNNFSTMVHVGDPKDYTRFILSGRLRGKNLYDHGQYVAVRESRHICGMQTITLESILAMTPVAQPLYHCFSNYDPKGRLTADLVYFGFLPPNQRIAVPRGAVIPVNEAGAPIPGILTGGKAISCTHDAFPALRMQPDLQQQGLALAALAVCMLKQETNAWQASGVDEQILAQGGVLAPLQAAAPPALCDAILKLDGNEPWEWLDAAPTACETQPSPIVQIMLAKSADVLPLLNEALAHAKTPALRLTLSRLLLWHFDDRGATEVMLAATQMLDRCQGLPKRSASINFGQLLPDHGLMPELVYLLNSLARARSTSVLPLFERVITRLEATPKDWLDLRAGLYCYYECFAYVALNRKDTEMSPLIIRLLQLLSDCPSETNELLLERFHMLRLTLLGALHKLGNIQGTQGLRAYLHSKQRPLALAAEMLLK